MLFRKKNTPHIKWIIAAACLLCMNTAIHAQYDTDSAVVAVDTVVNEEPDNTSSTDYNNDQLFLKKQEHPGGALTINERKIPDSLVRKMQQDADFWYANTTIEKEKEKTELRKPLAQRDWFQAVTWIIIIGGFATLLIIYLAGNNIGLFRKKNIIINETGSEEIPENIFAIDYQKEIDKAAAQGNFRMAIRLMFLRLLRNMSDRHIIQYQQDKTNFDYLLQLQPTRFYTGFFRLTRNYEYTWYGQFDVEQSTYGLIKKEFDQFENSLG